MNALIVISILAVLTMFLGVFNQRRLLLPVVVGGLLVALGFSVADYGQVWDWYHGMFRTENSSALFGSLMIASTLVVLLIPSKYYTENTSNLEAVYAVILFSLAGGLIMISSINLVSFFVGLEILSVSLYILAGSHKDSQASNEAAMKYFIMGSFASAFLLFGIALIYGATGSMYNIEIQKFINAYPGSLPTMLKAGIILLSIGMAFKVAAAPFHFWAPDVYHGSPTVISAYMITTVKVAGFAAFLKLTQSCFGADTTVWAVSIGAISAISIIVGNFSALAQTKTKRMLAYSSIAHTGYMLMALVSLQALSTAIFFYYSLAYVAANLIAFIVIIQLKQSAEKSEFDIFNGLSKTNPIVSLALAIAMLSLTGIPPLAGFMAKYFVFTSAIQAGYLWLAIVAIVGSIVSIFYYFKPIINSYMKEAEGELIPIGGLSKTLVFVLALVIIAGGLLPGILINL